MNNVMFGRYLPLNSFIHRLDPRMKIGALLILLISVSRVFIITSI